jgi:hypothetical protein
MTFADQIVLRCPGCRSLFVKETLGSANSFGAVFWTDGYMQASMFPIPPVMAYCRLCEEYFFLEEAEELFSVPPFIEVGELPTISTFDEMDDNDYREALRHEPAPQRERTLLLRLLWKLNHPLRYNSTAVVTREQQETLERLDELIDGEEEPIRRAEMLRELGHFEECLELLEGSISPEMEYPQIRTAYAVYRAAEAESIRPARIYGEEKGPFEALEMPKEEENTNPSIDPEILRHIEAQGLYPLPVCEDVLAFVSEEIQGELSPILSFPLSRLNPEWKGQAVFFHEDGEYLLRHGRLFTDAQWKEFHDFDESYRKELLNYWSRSSLDLPVNPEERNAYFRLQYLHFYHGFAPPPKEEEEQALRDFQALWSRISRDVRDRGGETAEWLDRYCISLYWNTFWLYFRDNFSEDFLNAEGLDAFRSSFFEYYEDLGKKRRKFLLDGMGPRIGEKPFPVGPPPAQNDNDRQFVAELWSGELDTYPSTLIRLYYNPREMRILQQSVYEER